MISNKNKKIVEIILNQGWLNASQVEHIIQEFEAANKSESLSIIELVRAKKLLSEKKILYLQKLAEPDKQKPQKEQASQSNITGTFQNSQNLDFNPKNFIGKEIGNCLLKKKLGQGGMGAVFLGVHQILDQTRAIKILPPNFARKKEMAERFIQEARMAAKLEHQNIVQVYDVGRKGIYLFIVMQHIDGGSLTKLLHNTNRLDVTLMLHITEQIALGLASAHKEGIIHRDIKPDNILLTRDGEVKIADFGLAKDMSINLENTGEGEIFGSPAYMSPEQCTGAEIDARSDLYSLGVTMYQMLTGQRPFVSATALAVLMMHQSEKPKPPRELINSIPAKIETMILKLMSKNPDNRYQSAKELLKDIERLKNQTETHKTIKIVKKNYESELLGTIAIKHKIMTVDQVNAVLRSQQNSKNQGVAKIPFGQAAVQSGYLSLKQLDKLLIIQSEIQQKQGLSIKPDENVRQYLKRIAAIIESQKQSDSNNISFQEHQGALEFPGTLTKSQKLFTNGNFLDAISVIDNYIRKFNGTSSAMKIINHRQEIVEAASNAFTVEGQNYIQKSLLDEAITKLNLAIQLSPDNAMAFNHRGIIFVRRNEWKKALFNFSKAIELDKTQAIFFLNRGNVQRRIQKLTNAFNDYSMALELDKNLDKALCNRGGILLSWKKYTQALKDFEHALVLNPNNEEAFNGRGKIYLKQGQLQKALIEFDKLCNLAPKNPRAFNSRGEVLYLKGHEDFAKKDFIRASSLNADYPDPYYNLAIIAAKHLDVKKAVEFLTKAFLKGFNKFKRFRNETAFKLINSTPEFQNLLKTIHLKPDE